jgi:Uma2 family endonuclease
MVQALSKRLTLDEFLKLPETKPASEFIDGQIIRKPMPQAKHSAVQGDFVPAVNQVLRVNRIARAFPELRCTFGGRSIVPDIAVFTWDRIQRDDSGKVINQVFVAPDWAIEILSPEQSQTKVVRKILHCLDHGTQMGWLIDPDEELIFLYRNDHTVFVFEDPAANVPVPNFASALQLTVGQIFSWLED